MDMGKLLESMNTEMIREYTRASDTYGRAFSSTHEMHGVIREEYEEALEDSAEFAKGLDTLWSIVRKDEGDIDTHTLTMQYYALRAAAEWIQVAAMCHKARVRKE